MSLAVDRGVSSPGLGRVAVVVTKTFEGRPGTADGGLQAQP